MAGNSPPPFSIRISSSPSSFSPFLCLFLIESFSNDLNLAKSQLMSEVSQREKETRASFGFIERRRGGGIEGPELHAISLAVNRDIRAKEEQDKGIDGLMEVLKC